MKALDLYKKLFFSILLCLAAPPAYSMSNNVANDMWMLFGTSLVLSESTVRLLADEIVRIGQSEGSVINPVSEAVCANLSSLRERLENRLRFRREMGITDGNQLPLHIDANNFNLIEENRLMDTLLDEFSRLGVLPAVNAVFERMYKLFKCNMFDVLNRLLGLVEDRLSCTRVRSQRAISSSSDVPTSSALSSSVAQAQYILESEERPSKTKKKKKNKRRKTSQSTTGSLSGTLRSGHVSDQAANCEGSAINTVSMPFLENVLSNLALTPAQEQTQALSESDMRRRLVLHYQREVLQQAITDIRRQLGKTERDPFELSYSHYYELAKERLRRTGHSSSILNDPTTTTPLEESALYTAYFFHLLYPNIIHDLNVANMKLEGHKVAHTRLFKRAVRVDAGVRSLLVGAEEKLADLIHSALQWFGDLLSPENSIESTLEAAFDYYGIPEATQRDKKEQIVLLNNLANDRLQEIVQLWVLMKAIVDLRENYCSASVLTGLNNIFELVVRFYTQQDWSHITSGWPVPRGALANDRSNELAVINEVRRSINDFSESREFAGLIAGSKKNPVRKKKQAQKKQNKRTERAQEKQESDQAIDSATVVSPGLENQENSVQALSNSEHDTNQENGFIAELMSVQNQLGLIATTVQSSISNNSKSKKTEIQVAPAQPKILRRRAAQDGPPVRPDLSGRRLNLYHMLWEIFNPRQRSRLHRVFTLQDARNLIKELGGSVEDSTKNRHQVWFGKNKLDYFEAWHGNDRRDTLSSYWITRLSSIIAGAALRGFIAPDLVELFPEGWENAEFGHRSDIITLLKK